MPSLLSLPVWGNGTNPSNPLVGAALHDAWTGAIKSHQSDSYFHRDHLRLLASEMSAEAAIVAWVNTFEAVGRKASSIQDLCDSVAFSELLSEIDPLHFQAIRPVETRHDLPPNLSALRRLHRSIIAYYDTVLQQPSSALQVPNLTFIARDQDTTELIKLATIILALVVQSENNQKYIQKMQSLDNVSQQHLMMLIQQVMDRLQGVSEYEAKPAASPKVVGRRQSDENHQLLKHQIADLQARYEEKMAETQELQSRLRDTEQSMAKLQEAGQNDFLLKTDISRLQEELESVEVKKQEAESKSEQLSQDVAELNRKLQDANRQLQVASRYKDQADEYRHTVEKLQKTEAMLEKYKKRLEEGATLQKQIKVLEDEKQAALTKSAHIEEEYRKLSSSKGISSLYKEGMSSSERKASDAMLAQAKAETALNEALSKLKSMEASRRADMDHMQALEEQLQHMQLNGGPQGESLPDQETPLLQQHIANLEAKLDQVHSTYEAEIASLNAKLSSKPNSSHDANEDVATKLINLTDQNAALHRALKKAKDLIVAQDKLSQSSSITSKSSKETYAEAIASYETMLKNKDAEYERVCNEHNESRAALQREARLIVSAWYELGVQLQQQRSACKCRGRPYPAEEGGDETIGSENTSPGRMFRAEYDGSTSWLAQQRKGLESSIRRAFT
ncbi:hypothetical protein SeMB42_g01393 [Synchytrium endobioticum]|uniref:HOOK N-terminal domain-containing protein n=1 Tax=Synchytrium endobioticum TaxID=286115 RepID=A0A507DG82_9FUNG|nr:hypothetical protein SeLEV6574_g01005 [Synchytrium endobioticum]TPX52490.1 hypothetical protein SeMB42_g01393 [Synchytrium endobioticum]